MKLKKLDQARMSRAPPWIYRWRGYHMDDVWSVRVIGSEMWLSFGNQGDQIGLSWIGWVLGKARGWMGGGYNWCLGKQGGRIGMWYMSGKPRGWIWDVMDSSGADDHLEGLHKTLSITNLWISSELQSAQTDSWQAQTDSSTSVQISSVMYFAIDAQKRYEVISLVVSQKCNRCQQNLPWTNPHNTSRQIGFW